MKEKKENIIHSSCYGKAQSGAAMGTASTESFAKRMEIDKNRQNIKKYNDSMVAEQRFNSVMRAKQYIPPEKTGNQGNFGASGRSQQTRGNMNSVPKIAPSTPNPPRYKTNFGR